MIICITYKRALSALLPQRGPWRVCLKGYFFIIFSKPESPCKKHSYKIRIKAFLGYFWRRITWWWSHGLSPREVTTYENMLKSSIPRSSPRTLPPGPYVVHVIEVLIWYHDIHMTIGGQQCACMRGREKWCFWTLGHHYDHFGSIKWPKNIFILNPFQWYPG